MIKLMRYGEIPKEEILARKIPQNDVADVVTAIIENVKQNGDAALYMYSERFDKVKLSSLRVSEEEKEEALTLVSPELIEVFKRAQKNIYAFHEQQKRSSFVLTPTEGVVMGQRIIPVEVAGMYVPGGTAAYPSTVLMDAIPAKIAGCPKVVMVTPPMKNGKVNPAILAAAHVAGVDEIYKVGGAQAIAALAYGTESIPKADKIVGPGNAYVSEAKKQVFGMVSIDMIAGPSEILVVADAKSNPAWLAADLLSQAEHDKMASAVLVTDCETVARAVQAEIEKQLKALEREEIARASIENNGKIIITDDIKTAIDVANEIAPEHLELCVDNPFDYLGLIKNAGSVFLGRNCPEALGDYLAGSNHTLPTSGTARFSSPLSVDDFIKKTQYTYFTDNALRAVAQDIAVFANAEGLTAHAKSAIIRMGEKE